MHSFIKKIVILKCVLALFVLLAAAKRLELLVADLIIDDDQNGRKCAEPVTICRHELWGWSLGVHDCSHLILTYMSWLFCQDPIRHPMQHLNRHPISQSLQKLLGKLSWKCHNLRYMCLILSSNRIMMEIQYVMNPSLQICQLLILWSQSISQLYPLVFATILNLSQKKCGPIFTISSM